MMKELVGFVGDVEASIVDWLNFVNHKMSFLDLSRSHICAKNT